LGGRRAGRGLRRASLAVNARPARPANPGAGRSGALGGAAAAPRARDVAVLDVGPLVRARALPRLLRSRVTAGSCAERSPIRSAGASAFATRLTGWSRVSLQSSPS